MNDWEKFTKQAFDSFLEGVNSAVEETQKNFQELSNQTQQFIEEMIREGEVKYNEWCNQQQNYQNRPREELRQRLFTLVHGDWTLAERLLDSAKRNNPGHSEDWYWEKVIYDLERDHRY
ncbi:MAG TPA: hypothetical protein DCL61_31695 [Cyanobacteria bacterium UBA12227]|nr:hypothetical protein [Cyanobacteria bacterium UBA12227]HAX85750.1 hypothetical protein [Cyanobacteria bacterium UBA11370]HBY76439.1 hypothetical protein [Cyanobacteria bacterium UBA11148]